MGIKNTEKIISDININVFFKEFTFSKNNFIESYSKQRLELADNVVWLDDIFFIYQIKDREKTESSDEKWFENKVVKKGVKQIKSTLQYLKNYSEITIENEKGHKINVSDANKIKPKKIIIYTPSNEFPENKRFIKFYDSSQVGLIHLFHSEDYYWICKYLLTPAEVDEYLTFRENLYTHQKKIISHLPEQYILGHFLETLEVDFINPRYIENLKTIETAEFDFNISYLIENFTNNIKLLNHDVEYYPIIKNIAKLNRSEMQEFKKRFMRCLEMCKTSDLITPYRIYIPRTDCGFVFITLSKENSIFWRTALNNYTLAQKYDQKAKSCIGLVVFEHNETHFEIYWQYAEFQWEFDSNLEKILQDNFPFREAKMKKVENRYKLN